MEAYRYLKVNLPNTLDVSRPEQESGSVNPSGWAEAGLPGPVSIPGDVGIPCRAGDLLEPAENLMGAPEKTQLESGAKPVYDYDFTPDSSGIFPTLAALLSLPPTHNRRRVFRGSVPGLQLNVAAGAPIHLRLPGTLFCHTSTMGEAIADVGNTGSFANTPQVRGVPFAELARPLNALHITVKSVSGGGVPTVQYEMCPVDGTPLFPSNQPGYAVQYDADARAKWQNAQGAVWLTGTVSVSAGTDAVTGVGTLFTDELEVGDSVIIADEVRVVSAIADDTGLTLSTNHTAGAAGVALLAYNRDLGIVDENKDPLEVLLPGDLTDHADLDAGDIWVFPLQDEWEDPTPSYDTDPRRVTAAHLLVEYSQDEGVTWTDKQSLSCNLSPSWPLTVDQGPGSKYPQSLDRDTLATATLVLTNKLRDALWDRIAETHGRVWLRVTYQSRLIGTSGVNRELMQWVFRGPLSQRQRPAANPGAVVETLTFRAETDASDNPPFTLKIRTPRNYTVAA